MRNRYNRGIFLFIILFVVSFLSVGYSAFDEGLYVDSMALKVRAKADIRITDISVSSVFDGVVHYSDYNVKNITSGISLSNSDSYVIYEVEVTNFGNIEMGILEINDLPDELEYELVDYDIKDMLCDNNGSCKLGSKSKFYLKIKYKDKMFDSNNVDFDFTLDFVFKKFYSVLYENFDTDISFVNYVMEGDSLRIDFSSVKPSMLSVSMNGIDLVSGANYEFYNYIFTLNDVLGDVVITFISGRDYIDTGIHYVNLSNVSYSDDNYLFAGDIYYLNPYDLSIECSSSNYVEDASDNPNSCMKWYQISEDDEFVTLILNSNLGRAIDESDDITTTANTYMKSFTDKWDDELLVFDGVLIDGYNYSNYKARMITMDEVSSVLENANWSKDNYSVSISNIKKYYNFLFDNINMDSWKEAGYFTSTKYSDSSNYVFNKGGIDFSVSDSYTHGVRPVIVVKKDILNLGREKVFGNRDVTYLNSSMVSSNSSFSVSNLEFQVKNMRAAGINKAYLNIGHLELIMEDDKIVLDDTISSFITSYSSRIARFMRIGKEYGVEIVPWVNFWMELDYINTNYSDGLTWGRYVIDEFSVIIDNILSNGFYCEDDGLVYYPKEIHLDAEPMNKKYQSYYLELIKGFDLVIGERANFSVASPAGDYFSSDYIKTLAKYINSFNVMIYDSNGPNSDNIDSKSAYLDYVKRSIMNYTSSLSEYKTKIYALGAMYEDLYDETSYEGWPDSSSNLIYKHLNIYNGEEIETIGNLVEGVISLDDSRLTGIGIYNWEGFSSYYSGYNNDTYITDTYNYITVRKEFLKEWVYK